MRKFFLVFALFFFVGCSSIQPTTGNVVSGTLTTTAHDVPETDVFDLTPEAAKLKIKLAEIRARVEIAKAEADAEVAKAKVEAINPCAAGWFKRPAWCVIGMVPYRGTGGAYGTNGPAYGINGGGHRHSKSCRH